MPLNSPLIFNEIFQNSESTSILIFNPTGKIEDVNNGFLKSFGYSRSTIIGKNFSKLFLEEDLKKHIPAKVITKVLESGSSHDDNYLKHRDGSHIWIHGECIYAKDEKGQEHIIKIINDLNKAKELEQKLKEKNEAQNEIIKDHENFIYTTSHDLKSPINNLEALVNGLGEIQDLPEEARFHLPLLNTTLQRLKQKINEISAIGKEQRTEIAKKPPVEFQEVVNEVLLDLEQEINSADAEIFYDFSQVPVIGFVKKNLKSILQNLILNSLKYRSDERKPKMKIETVSFAEYILLTVQDNGLGITEGEKERVFKMYHRLHTHVGGTGVGLAIVKKIIEDAGGKIEVDSRVGEGTKFKVYLKSA
jgi:PAS domain S-box-containing protein